MTRIEWTRGARRDLISIRSYIEADSASNAAHFVERLILSVDQLASFPKSGRRVPETDDDSIRELIFENYRIVYKHLDDQVQIVAVIHGARDFTRMKLRSWEK